MKQQEFGLLIREHREKLRKTDPTYSLRKVAHRIQVEPAYLSKIERGEVAPPSEKKIVALAEELNLEPNDLLAKAGKVSSDLLEIIQKRPKLFAELIQKLDSKSDEEIQNTIREIRDGDW